MSSNKRIFRQIRYDCFRFSYWNHLFYFLASFLEIASPTVVSWLIGDMANYLLELNAVAIRAQLPYFFCAILLNVVVTPLVALINYLKVTQDGFHFDNHLIEQMLHLPMARLRTMEKGTAIERFSNDSPALMWNQLILHTKPFVLLAYGGVVAFLFTSSKTHWLFFIIIFVFSSLPILRSVRVGKKRSVLNAQTAAYTETRRTLEQELLEARDLTWGFPINKLLTGSIHKHHSRYMETTGQALCRQNALEKVVSFLCDNGAQVGTVLFGAVMVSQNMLTLGSLLGGLLMQPALANCCGIIYWLVFEAYEEKKYLERMSFLYEGVEEVTDGAEPEETIRGLTVKGVSYTYPDQLHPAVNHWNLLLRPGEVVRLVGANGSGKSTMLSMLGGLYVPDCGEICNEFGTALHSVQLCRNVSLCQQTGVIFSGTVEENLFLPQDRMKEAADLLDSMGFGKPLSYAVEPGGTNLSYGEQKKLLLVRAILKNADILLLDEPLNHLDEQGKAALVQALQKHKGTLVYVSHEEFLPVARPIRHINVE